MLATNGHHHHNKVASTATTTTTTTASPALPSLNTSPVTTISIPKKHSSSRPRYRRRKSSQSSTDQPPDADPQPSPAKADAATTQARQLTTPNGRRRRLTASLASPQPSPDTEVRPSTSSSIVSSTLSPKETGSPAASYFALRSNPSGAELRSPLQPKRPPASRSSHGIETASGPPPALSTQRSFSIDSWRFIAAEASSPLSPDLSPRVFSRFDAAGKEQEGGIDALITEPVNEVPDEEDFEIHDPDTIPSIESQIDASMTTTVSQHESRLTGDKASKLMNGRFDSKSQANRDSHSSNEDLFFDLANGEETNNVTIERRPSRKGAVSHRHTLSQPNAKISASQNGNEEGMQPSPNVRDRRGSLRQSEMGSARTPTSAERTATSRDRNYASSAHPLDSRPLDQRVRSRLSSGNPKPILTATRGLSTRERSPESPSYIARRQSVTEAQPYRYRNHLQYGANGTYHSSPLTGRQDQYPPEPSPPAREGTESSVSTTAPSTVWDELDDLKSRIRKLELTGKLPSSSGSAMASSGERPRTATTTVTTMSSSPKRQTYGTSPTFKTDFDTEIHPLLRSALAKTQSIVSPEIFRSLEASASDALTLARLGSNSTPGSATQMAIERQLKRKTDSLCRSLTELCIALSEDSSTERASTRPISRDASRSRPRSIVTDEPRFPRATSLDPEPSSARVLSRLEARRLSLMSGTTVHASPTQHTSSTPHASTPSSTYPNPDYQVDNNSNNSTLAREPPTPTQTTLGRTSNVLQRIRDGTSNESDTTIRPLSRARTELGRRSIGNADRTSYAEKRKSREYTSNHPLPNADSRAESWAPSPNAPVARESSSRDGPGAASGLPVRRSHLTYQNSSANSANASPAQVHQKDLPSLPRDSLPGTPTTTVGVAESTPGRIARRSYLDGSADSTRVLVDGQGQAQPQGQVPARRGSEDRRKRLSNIGMGGLRGSRGQ